MSQLDLVANLKPRVLNLPLSEATINVADESPFAQLRGIGTAVMSPKATADYIRILGIDPKTLRNIRTDDETAAKMVLANRVKQNKHTTLSFVLDKDAPRITRIVEANAGRAALKPMQIVQMSELLVKKGMQLWDVSASPDGTSADVTLVNPQIHHHAMSEQESVQIGRTIHFDALGGTSFNEFLQRMWCSNGATLNEQGKVLGHIDPNMNASDLFELLFVKGAESRLKTYFNRVQRFQEMLMSVREWRQMEKYLLPFSSDKDAFESHIGFNLERPTWEKEYDRKGIDLNAETTQQLRNRTTPINWWSAINLMTWLGSHETKSKVSDWDKAEIRSAAGGFISRNNFDSQAWVNDNPSWN